MYNSLEKINKGIEYANIASVVTKNELTIVVKVNIKFLNHSVAKFIPASGAATRMFRDLYAYVENQINTDFVDYFFEQLENFALYKELNTYIDIKSLDFNNAEDRVSIIATLLNNEMNYGNLPKALIKFH